MTEPKYLMTLFEINKLIYERNMIDASDVAPYLFKDGWVKCSEGNPDLRAYERRQFLCIDENRFEQDKRCVYLFNGYNGYWYDDSETVHPTYFMPLPSQPPKEEN